MMIANTVRYRGSDVPRELNLHCGACGTEQRDIYRLRYHIEHCTAVAVMLPLVYKQFDDKLGHPYSSYVQLLHRAIPLIKQYAQAISGEMDNMTRSSIHAKLCDALYIDYGKFKPFEANYIKNVPSFKLAEEMIWRSLGLIVNDKIVNGEY